MPLLRRKPVTKIQDLQSRARKIILEAKDEALSIKNQASAQAAKLEKKNQELKTKAEALKEDKKRYKKKLNQLIEINKKLEVQIEQTSKKKSSIDEAIISMKMLNDIRIQTQEQINELSQKSDYFNSLETTIHKFSNKIDNIDKKIQGILNNTKLIDDTDKRMKNLIFISEDIKAKLGNFAMHEQSVQQAIEVSDKLQFMLTEAGVKINELTERINLAEDTEK